MLCIVFVAGGNLVVYATEDELTNEVDEANENRFSEKSPWLDHADESTSTRGRLWRKRDYRGV